MFSPLCRNARGCAVPGGWPVQARFWLERGSSRTRSETPARSLRLAVHCDSICKPHSQRSLSITRPVRYHLSAMKSRKIAVLKLSLSLSLLLSFVVLPTLAQSAPAAKPKVTMELGPVTVWLGEPKEQVMADLAHTKSKVTTDKSTLVITFGDRLFYVDFKDNRVAYASRPSTSKSKNATDALFDAVKELNDKGEQSCRVFREDRDAPDDSDARVKQIFIICNRRSIRIMIPELYGQGFPPQIFEQIGELPN